MASRLSQTLEVLRLKRRPENTLARVSCISFVVVMLLVCGGCMGLESVYLLISSPGHFVLAVTLATATTLPYTLLLLWLDRNEQEPLALLAMSFLWGAVVATAISGTVNNSFSEMAYSVVDNAALANQLSASFSAPFIEELTKGVALLALFIAFFDQFDNVLDGIIYGAIIGMGFAWCENILYYMAIAQAVETNGVLEMLELAFARGVLSGIASHAAYTGLTGLGFGLVRVLRRGWARWALVPVFLSLAMFGHFIWNTFADLFMGISSNDATILLVSLPMAVAVLQMPFVMLLFGVVVFSWRHEVRVIHGHLVNEKPAVIRNDELAALFPARKRNLAALQRFLVKGPRAWWRHRTLEQLWVQLAFTKWHHKRDEGISWEAGRDEAIVHLRERIVRLRTDAQPNKS